MPGHMDFERKSRFTGVYMHFLFAFIVKACLYIALNRSSNLSQHLGHVCFIHHRH